MSKKIKVCHVITRMIIGGAQENTLYTCLGLSEMEEYSVTLITGPTTGPEGKIDIPEGRKFQLIELDSLRRAINPIYDLIALWRLWRIFRKEKFDVVHTHSSKAGILGRFSAWLAQIPVIIHTIHGLAFHAYQNKILNFIYIRAERWMGRITSQIISVADAMTKQALAAGIANPDNFVTIRSAMDLSMYQEDLYDKNVIRNRYGLSDQHIVVGTIARLFELKGHDYIIKIAPDLVKNNELIRFLFVGDGILYDTLCRLIEKAGLKDYFIFTGLVRPEEIPGLISIMDILVHVSLREGLAKAIPQAFALQKPVVCHDLDGSSELVKEGLDGFLVQPGDLKKLSENILALSKDKNLRVKMGKEGYKLILPDYDKEIMIEKIHSLYQRLLVCGL